MEKLIELIRESPGLIATMLVDQLCSSDAGNKALCTDDCETCWTLFIESEV